MKNLLWQEAPKAERVKICAFYAKYIARKEGLKMTVEQLDIAWTDCWFNVIKYTFGPDSWTMK